MAFRYISADRHPDHDTIATFRKRFLAELEGLFKQILMLAAALGVVRLGAVSLDGSKIQGNASKHKAMSWGHANKLEEQLQGEARRLLELAERADSEAPEQQEELDIPAELQRRQERLAAIQEAKAKIEERAQERHADEQAEYEQKLKAAPGARGSDRQEAERATATGAGGRTERQGSGELHRRTVAHHASRWRRVRAGLPTRRRWWSRTVTWWWATTSAKRPTTSKK